MLPDRNPRSIFATTISSPYVRKAYRLSDRSASYLAAELQGLPPELGALVDLDDPDLGYIIKSVQGLRSAGLDVVDPVVFQMAVTLGREQAAVAVDDTALQPETELQIERQRRAVATVAYLQQLHGQPVVYYMRTGNRCKIGRSQNVVNRVKRLVPEELLVVEPGAQDLERSRHVQFAHLRTRREWFRYEGELVEHVRQLQEKFMADVAAA